MKANLNKYRLAGIIGGFLLTAGQFFGFLCVLQLFALVPLMLLCLHDKRPRWAMLAGMYMGLAYTIPQMIYLRMPLVVTVILLLWLTILLMLLCVVIAFFIPRHRLLGPAAVGAAWYILDWVNYTVVPIWGMAQSFGRSWTAYPLAIQFISITGISGVLFVIGTLSGLGAYIIVLRSKQDKVIVPPSGQGAFVRAELSAGLIVLLLVCVNAGIWFQKPTGLLKVAAAGWVFDSSNSEINPNNSDGFEKLFAGPAKEAAAKGARIFTTGELGFYIADHERDEWLEQFAQVARDNELWLVVGYFNITEDENRLFFMSPEGAIIHEYAKTYLTPLEAGQKGNGDLKTVQVDGLTVGAMICQDDNFSKLTRYYGNLKADIVLCPTADWWTIKDAHLQAVRARTIECGYGIVRGAACGISSVISPRGEVLDIHDHYKNGPGTVIDDISVVRGKTLFSRYGHWPSLTVAGLIIACSLVILNKVN
jgi:apolipoprotein N-acyltransferase